jgi:hypothetical protein
MNVLTFSQNEHTPFATTTTATAAATTTTDGSTSRRCHANDDGADATTARTSAHGNDAGSDYYDIFLNGSVLFAFHFYNI